MESLKKYALHVPQILLPAKGTDLESWAVVACDQYTQDKDYWQSAEKIAQGKPSTLHIILPEIYLNTLSQAEKKRRTDDIKRTMADYLANGVFAPPLDAFIYTERKTSYGRLRKGLVAAIDLEAYDWRPEQKAKIRATEATILERIPPRVAIREGAPLEAPHIMLLVNDPARRFIEQTGEIVKQSGEKPVYDTDLMMEGGRITGRAVSGGKAMDNIVESLGEIEKANKAADGSVFMFAVGDGNHSLATAKTVWENLKKTAGASADKSGHTAVPDRLKNHPARYALVEIVNLYDEGLTFEPIHRVLFNTDAAELIRFVHSKLGGTLTPCKDGAELARTVEQSPSAFGFASLQGGFTCLNIPTDALAVSVFQPVLDEFIRTKEMIDFIHGADEVFRLAKQKDTVSILFPPIAKGSFFATVEKYGSLPRKSFSMGEASEKRFYLECRKLL